MDDETEAVQPEGEGQGSEAAGGSPWESLLTRFPEETRDEAASAFREMEGSFTKRFQEAAQAREQWQPFEQLGVNQRDPAEVEWALQMLEAAKTNPASVWEWAQEYAKTHNLTQAETAQLEEEIAVDPSITQLLEQQLEAKLGPIAQQLQDMSQWRDGLTQKEQQDHIQSEIRSELDSLKEKHGAEFDEGLVDKFIANHMPPPEADVRIAAQKARLAVQQAFADAQAVVGQIEKKYAQSKVDAPSGAESGGQTPSGADAIKSLKEAGRIATEQLRQANRA